jgi:type I restriction enzyme R subunit
VLGFDPYKVLTYRDRDLRVAIALEQAKANDEAEAIADPSKRTVFYRFMNEIKMAGHIDYSGRFIKGIEDYLPSSQYERPEHHQKVVEDIVDNWLTLSQNGKFHALFATSSIPEAIEYYRLFKTKRPDHKVTALFDPTIDNGGGVVFKEDALVEILEDYNRLYEQDFSIPSHANFKKDVAARMAHKKPHDRIEKFPERQIDLLIVVDQMLTGFDSKWINTLYLDKVLHYENIIQAFSRTNRLFGPDKPFGTIRYYRLPHTMERHIQEAVKLYSGDKPLGLFVDRLPENLRRMNATFAEIVTLFDRAGLADLAKLPDDLADRGRFAKLFRELNGSLEAAKVQGFAWDKVGVTIDLDFDESQYLVLALRYKELFEGGGGGGGTQSDVPYEIEGYLTEIDTGKIDADFMNSQFTKFLKVLNQPGIDQQHLQASMDELHQSFAYLTQEEQKYADIFLRDVQRGDIDLSSGMTMRDYLTQYLASAKTNQIQSLVVALGLQEPLLRQLMKSGVTESNLNEYGRFDELRTSVDKSKARAFFEKRDGKIEPDFKISLKTSELLRRFILGGGFDL